MGFKVIKESVLKANDDVAEDIRTVMDENRVFMVNIISSPGAGKTTFLEKVGPLLKENGIDFAIITGDCFTTRDAERIDVLGFPVIQINTGNSCHIDAQLVKKAVSELNAGVLDLIIVENVGNLVCPAEFDVGEDVKIAFHSVAEGHDKPVKYPLLVKMSKLAIINKMDLLDQSDFDMEVCTSNIKVINPDIDIIKISCKNGDNLDSFVKWIKLKIQSKKEKKHEV